MGTNSYNLTFAALAVVLTFCIVNFNQRLSSLNGVVDNLLEENQELRNNARALSPGSGPPPGNGRRLDLKEKLNELKDRVKVNENKIKVNANNADTIAAAAGVSMNLVCPLSTYVAPHWGTKSSKKYCKAGTAKHKCVKAFMIADGTEIDCDDVVDATRNDKVDVVDACCKANPKCPTGTMEAWHYGSGSSDSYCGIGTTTVPAGSNCQTAFELPLGNEVDCTYVKDVASRTDTVLACCVVPPADTCPDYSGEYQMTGDGNTTTSEFCKSNMNNEHDVDCVGVLGNSDCSSVPINGNLLDVCCAGTRQFCFDTPSYIHDGSVNGNDYCPNNACAWQIRLADMTPGGGSRPPIIDCDVVVGEPVQACC